MIIREISQNKSNGQLLIYVHKKDKLKKGDQVELIKIPERQNYEQNKNNKGNECNSKGE